MTKHSALIWKNARLNVEPSGLPGCPEDLSEPQYAHLLFGDRCDVSFFSLFHLFWIFQRMHRAAVGAGRINEHTIACDEGTARLASAQSKGKKSHSRVEP